MTNKQIINTCEFLDVCVAACGGTLEDTEMCPCYELHKQLDQLKSENDVLFKAIEEVNKINKKLKAENEELKEQLTILDGEDVVVEITVKQFEEYKKLKVENEELKKTIDDLLHKPEIQDKILWKIDNEALLGSKDAWIYKLGQTLEEIKEIIEQGVKIHDDIIINKQILQKISEVEE